VGALERCCRGVWNITFNAVRVGYEGVHRGAGVPKKSDGTLTRFTVVGIGELLWDLFPEGKQLGGAPANFAYMTSLLGDEGLVASRIGNDALGRSAARRLQRIGLKSTYLQIDPSHPTGTVKVQVDPNGQPTFEIAESVAWDFFQWTNEWHDLAEHSHAVCFGSLAQRSPESRATIRAFLEAVGQRATRIFDVNLRQTFYSRERLEESLELTDIAKLNQDELPLVVKLLGHPEEDEERAARWLRDNFRLKLVCVTRGAIGSLLVSEKETSKHPGCKTEVADTVGSGDAFTAALVYHYLRRASLATLNEAANRMGSWVASQTGATPPRDNRRLERIRSTFAEQR
jgi:fructokinase